MARYGGAAGGTGKRVTPYGIEALVRRDAMPAGAELDPVSIEELFVLMVKGENVQ